MPPAATRTPTRQPNAAATKPLNVRASRIPISSPLITVPTTRPRSYSAASEELMGTITWATLAVKPTTANAPANTA